jgi:hypothetical protein
LLIATYRPRGRTLSTVTLSDAEFMLVTGPTWAARIGGAQQLADDPAAPQTVPLITHAEDLPIVGRYWRPVGRQLTNQAAVTIPNLRGVSAATIAGTGFSALPRCLCTLEFDSGAASLTDSRQSDLTATL